MSISRLTVLETDLQLHHSPLHTKIIPQYTPPAHLTQPPPYLHRIYGALRKAPSERSGSEPLYDTQLPVSSSVVVHDEALDLPETGNEVIVIVIIIILFSRLKAVFSRFEDVANDRNTRDYLAWTIGTGDPMQGVCIPQQA